MSKSACRCGAKHMSKSKWRFPKIGVPPNHPFWWDFPLQTKHFGVPPFMESLIYQKQNHPLNFGTQNQASTKNKTFWAGKTVLKKVLTICLGKNSDLHPDIHRADLVRHKLFNRLVARGAPGMRADTAESRGRSEELGIESCRGRATQICKV